MTAARFDAAAPVVADVRAELLERLQYFNLAPRVILDLGAGTGAAAAALRARYPRSLLVALDRSPGMLREARLRQRFWRRHPLLRADAQSLPLAGASVDLVFSNLMAQCCDDPAALYAEIRRVLRPGGLLLASCLGSGTLAELRECWAEAGATARVAPFPDITGLAGALAAAGLVEPVVDREDRIEHYASLEALHEMLRAAGAGWMADDGRDGGAPAPLQAALAARYEARRVAAGLPVTIEILHLAAFAGQGPRTTSLPEGGTLATIAADSIGRRKS